MDDPNKRPNEALIRMSDTLVKLGYATAVRLDDSTQRVTVAWTPKGLAMKRDLRAIFQTFGPSDQVYSDDIKMLFALFLGS